MLVVEANPAVRREIRNLFLARGFFVNSATRTADAVSLTDQDHYDVVVCDVQPPGIDATELTRALRGAREAPMIVVITTAPLSPVMEEAFRDGRLLILRRPVGPAILLAAVERVLAAFEAEARSP